MNKWLELLKSDDYLGIKKHIKKGADLQETNEAGESVLACALRAGCSIETLMLLVESGADIFDFDDEGVSIFDMAITYDNIHMVSYLLEQGIDVNKTTRKSGFTALMAAACYGRVEIIKLLLENGANQYAKDSKGFSAIDFARKMNKKSVLALLDYDPEAPKNTDYAR
ncbi:ankyrin repeat domain-containing protein [Sulfurimonas paralvinellae]|uniref:Ankyrin repeat domain-containing protein n=1 Tax=Sulfurimonas paralvinellae TaxID=317658 RepID=A0A7M1B7L8_9BACT|nr:ankyrin repeat domain-containing protein [Sulfurimonas paralvinellae]QOP45645.1 ankyrin repeat domain-containing protein [Sulfurimonas paralvinellae]